MPDIDLEIVTSSRMFKDLKTIRVNPEGLNIRQESLEKEMSLTLLLLGKNRYKDKLQFREDIGDEGEALRRISIAKFQTYAEQALQIESMFPNAILIQNEVPTDVREEMYRCGGSKIPMFYPYKLFEPPSLIS